MADNMPNRNSINQSIADYIETMSMSTDDVLKSIDLTLKAIARQDGLMISQSSLKDLAQKIEQSLTPAEKGSSSTQSHQSENKRSKYGRSTDFDIFDIKYAKQSIKNSFDKFTDDIEDGFSSAFKEALFGSANPFEDAMKEPLNSFARRMGGSIDDLGKNIGKKLGEQVSNAFKDNPLGQRLQREWQTIGNTVTQHSINFLNQAGDVLDDPNYLRDIFRRRHNTQRQQSTPDFEYNESDVIDTTYREVPEPGTEGIVSEGMNHVREAFDDAASDVPNFNEVLDLGSNLENVGTSVSTFVEGLTTEGSEIATQLPMLSQAATSLATQFPALGTAMTSVGPAIAGAGSAVAGFAAAFPIATAAIAVAAIGAAVVIDKLSEAVGPAIEGFKKFAGSLSSAANYDTKKARELLDLQKARIEADQKAIVTAAYDVIEQSAQKVEQVWDNVFATVVTAQGYDKAGVQDLWSSYAQRLKDNNLASVISSADIMEKLESVLQKGLSGAVAEEFAYQATLLSNAVPTQDFFQYADTYASIAANAMKNGLDQATAIQVANSELTSFANNLLYASREIAGGFTTSLSDGSELFKQAANIALTSRIGDISDISGVLTSVSAIVGATVPDMASSIVDAVVQAATGGNSSELTALRSLAGVGASNTAFLREFARNPQAIFETMFRNLAQLQNMSSSNYMEVAEALSGTFGMSLDAFARVDFAYLADAISSMNLNSEALQSNMDLLAAGQTASTDSQLRMQKINEYMVDQGLAYVLDNEVARSIQENMWAEQRAQQIMENQFSVDIVGGALELFNGIATTLTAIGNILNPVSWIKKAGNVLLQAAEATQADNKVEDLLKAVKVGNGNQQAFHWLTTTGTEFTDLATKQSYLQWLGAGSVGRSLIDNMITLNNVFSPANDLSVASALSGGVDAGAIVGKSAATAQTAGTSAANSFYTHSLIGKTQASALKMGDWRAAQSYNALYGNFEESSTENEEGARSDKDAQELTDKLTTEMAKYIQKNAGASTSLDSLRKVITETGQGSASTLVARDMGKLATAMSTNLTAEQKAKGQLQGLEHRDYYTQADLSAEVMKALASQASSEEGQGGSFDDWVKEFEKSQGKQEGWLSKELSMYSQSLDDLRKIYDEQETAKSSAESKARELHEVQFWEDMQQFATQDFPWYMREWERYYIQHEAYNTATNEAYKAAVDLKDLEKKETGDSVLALANALLENTNWQQENQDALKEPVLHTNVLLAKILTVTEAIMQQNNETSIVSVPTSLSSLGLGISN